MKRIWLVWVGMATLGACAHAPTRPARVRPDGRADTTAARRIGRDTSRAAIGELVPRPPRSWDAADLTAPQRKPAYVVSDTVSPLPWGKYPATEDEWKESAPGFSPPVTLWRSLDSLTRALRVPVSWAHAEQGMGSVGGTMTVRRSVWPTDAVVEARDSSSLRVATAALPLAGVPEVRCAAVASRKGAAVRLVADVVGRGGEVEVRPMMVVVGGTGCEGAEKAGDRVRGFAADVFMAVRSAGRSGVPVPIRP